jgi:gas vesicle protein
MRDIKSLSLLYAFLGGAILGCGLALLYAPESGKDLRTRIKELLKKKGIDFSDDEVEQLVNQISAQIEQ